MTRTIDKDQARFLLRRYRHEQGHAPVFTIAIEGHDLKHKDRAIHFNVHDVPPSKDRERAEKFSSQLQHRIQTLMKVARAHDRADNVPQSMITSYITFEDGSKANFSSMLLDDGHLAMPDRAAAKAQAFTQAVINWSHTVPYGCPSDAAYHRVYGPPKPQ